jgi:hypothetical protein
VPSSVPRAQRCSCRRRGPALSGECSDLLTCSMWSNPSEKQAW